MSNRPPHKQGSAIVESCIVIALLCLVLFGILQKSYVVAARNVLNYAAIATARAASVGLDDDMLYKVSHYCTIPTAGPTTLEGDFGSDRPEGQNLGAQWDNAISRKNRPRSKLGEYEIMVREAYLLIPRDQTSQILDYENWGTDLSGMPKETDYKPTVTYTDFKRMIRVDVEQTIPLTMPFSRVFYWNLDLVEATRNGRKDKYPGAAMSGHAYIEDHSQLYLKDMTN